MRNPHRFHKLEKTIAHDKRLLFTLCSYVLTLGIYINLSYFHSPAVGIAASILYFSINAIFLGHALFLRDDTFFRLMLGILSLIALLGFVGWMVLIIYNLDVIRFTLVLVIVATICSLLNGKVKNKNDN